LEVIANSSDDFLPCWFRKSNQIHAVRWIRDDSSKRLSKIEIPFVRWFGIEFIVSEGM